MAFGVNFKTAPLSLREKMAIRLPMSETVIQGLLQTPYVKATVLITTCNRTELYCDVEDKTLAFQWFLGLLPSEELKAYCYHYSDALAVKHLMRVASGLESMVLGEVEILGQLKTAYSIASKAGTLGKKLGRLFQTSFSVAKTVRTQTGIGVNPVSMAYAAKRLAERIFTDLRDTTVLLIGAGDLISLTAKHLQTVGMTKMMIANRNEARALSLAKQFSAKVLKLEAIPSHLHEADIVITGTNSVLPIVGKGMVETALKSRKHRPMLMVDFSVPRDIEPEVSLLEDVYLYCIDDLQVILEENRHLRQKAAFLAEQLIEAEAEAFMAWLQAQDSLSTLRSFRRKYETIQKELLNGALQKLKLGKLPEEVLQQFGVTLTNRLLHEPTIKMRQASFARNEEVLSMIRALFELNEFVQ